MWPFNAGIYFSLENYLFEAPKLTKIADPSIMILLDLTHVILDFSLSDDISYGKNIIFGPIRVHYCILIIIRNIL